jgi:hypothetical protein
MESAMTKQTFTTAAAAREYLVSLGFESFRKGLTKGRFVSKTGRVAHYGMCLLSKTYQHSIGEGAQWGYSVQIEGA